MDLGRYCMAMSGRAAAAAAETVVAVLMAFQPGGLRRTQRSVSLVTVQCWDWEGE